MIASPHHSSRRGARVRLVVLHTAEGARTVGDLGRFFQGKVPASSHVGIDDHRIEQYVPYDRAAWTLLSGNPVSDNAELCGFAKWTRAEWLQRPRMLELAAQWIGERCRARNIPLRKLTPAQVAAGESGVCGHHDWTVGKREGSHWDPGPHFPWDLVLNLAAGGHIEEDELPTPKEVAAATLDMPLGPGADPDSLSAFVVRNRDVAEKIDELLELFRPGIEGVRHHGRAFALLVAAAERDEVDEAEIAAALDLAELGDQVLAGLYRAAADELARRRPAGEADPA
ncbi:N-acetylmuramoyl-L-alanine amidase [Crossiella sp. CA198]|uniref:N-acetylmuramoyl-L-alanine amidase n=1 Tax=Crossiella sp. CA198 TaxID=3455607 RepID=UPI003F8D2A9C